MDFLWIILAASYLLPLVVQQRLRGAYRKWGSVRNSAKMTGAATARALLNANEIEHVTVHPIRGILNDHYDPRDRSIRLSEPIFDTDSVAAMAVAAHETGHAIQHESKYWLLSVRSGAAPLANLGARLGVPAALIGLILGSPSLIQIGIIGYVGALAFQILTLPVEFDASKRALAELDRLKLLSREERAGTRKVLQSAAMTYFASVASSAAYVVYLALLVSRWVFGKSAPLPPPRLP